MADIEVKNGAFAPQKDAWSSYCRMAKQIELLEELDDQWWSQWQMASNGHPWEVWNCQFLLRPMAIHGRGQIVRGVVNTPSAIVRTARGEVWNTETRKWEKERRSGEVARCWKNCAICWCFFFTRPGQHTKNYGKSSFSMGKSTINGHFQ